MRACQVANGGGFLRAEGHGECIEAVARSGLCSQGLLAMRLKRSKTARGALPVKDILQPAFFCNGPLIACGTLKG